MPWTTLRAEGSALPEGRGGHAVAVLDTATQQHLYVFGGADRSPCAFADLWRLTLSGGACEWRQEKPTLPDGASVAERTGASMTAIDGRLYIFGGQEPQTGVCFNDVIVFDPATGSWHRAMVAGGSETGPSNEVWVFDTQTLQWSRPTVKGQSPAAREMHVAVHVQGVGLVIHGGRADGGAVASDVHILNTDTLEWGARHRTRFARCAHAAVAVSPDRVLLLGGFTGENVEGTVLVLNPSTGEITTGEATEYTQGGAPSARFAHAAARVAAVGGDGSAGMVVFGGVTPETDLADVAIWAPPVGMISGGGVVTNDLD